MTAEQITPTKARFDAVSARLDSDLTAAEAADPGIREKLSTILQMIYEFDWATLSEPQRGRALQSYEAAPNPVQCGAMVDPSILGQCQSTDWMLQYCARMTGEHVSPDLIWSRAMHDSGAFNGSVADFCFNVLAEMDAASCRMENAITEAFDVDRALLRKAGVGFEEALPQCLGPEGEGRLERIAATSTMFEFVQQWHNTVVTAAQKAGNGITELRLDDELTGALGDMWTAVDKRLDLSGELARSSNVDGGHLTCGRETSLGLVDMFEAATQRSIEVDQDVLLAATGALEGAPLLAALGHITQAQIGRLDAQRVSHDLACKFTGCGAGSATAQTRVAYLYRLISLLDRPDDGQSPDPAQGIFEDLSEALQDPSRPSTEWWSTFNQLQPNQQRIVDALGTYTPNGYSPEAFRALTMGDLLRSARPFVDAIRRSKRRYDNYINAGSLTPRIGRYLRTPVNHERRGEVEFLLQRYANALEVDVQSFESNMQTILSALPTITQNAQTEARLVVELDRISRELDRIDERRDAHATGAYRSGVDEQIGQAWIDVNGMLESGGVPTQFIEIDQVPGVGDPPIQVSGASAPRNRRGSITQLAVPWNGGVASISANPGEILVVEVPSQDQYSPKCVIEALHPQDGYPSGQAPPLVAPLTGPAGYTLSESNSTYSAKSISDTVSQTAGIRTSICMSTPPVSIGITVQTCGYSDTSVNVSKKSDLGSDSRTSASFQGGFYHPLLTPFVAPVGSLVVVEMPAGETNLSRLRDVHVVTAPSATIVVRDDASGSGSDFYLVVNDQTSYCPGAPDSRSVLNVTMRRLHSQQTQARETLDAMGDVIHYMRGQEAQMVKQRDILPHQLSAIENHARSLLPARVRSRANYPAPLGQVFDALIVAEKSRLEHAVRLAVLDDERDNLIDELAALQADLRYVRRSHEQLSAIPRWSVRNLDIGELNGGMERTMALLSDYVFPILETWYPNILSQLPHDPVAGLVQPNGQPGALGVLRDQAPGTSLHKLADATHKVADFILNQLPLASLPGVWHDAEVAVTFPRPGQAGCNELVCAPAGPTTAFNRGQAGIANAIWSSLDSGAPVTVHVRPEDLYRYGGGNARLGCSATRVVLRELGFALVDPNNNTITPSQTGLLQFTVDVTTSAEQLFAVPNQPITYELLGDEYLAITTSRNDNHLREMPNTTFVEADEEPSSNGYVSAMVPAAWNRRTNTPLGRSPFASFTFDMSNAISPSGVISPSDIASATELVVYMKVGYYVGGASSMEWIPTCAGSGSEVCTDGYDNDSNGDIDCADSACVNDPVCAP